MNIFLWEGMKKKLTGVHYNGKKKIVRNSEQILLEAGKRVQSIKFKPSNHEDLSLDPQPSRQNLCLTVYT